MRGRKRGNNLKKDISANVVLILVFLAVIISVLSTWTVLSAVDSTQNTATNNVATEENQEEDISSDGVLSLTVTRSKSNG